MKSSRSRPANSTTIQSRSTRIGGAEKFNAVWPILPWMAGSYCLPIVALRNDLNGSALQYIRLTSMFDAFSPYIYKNKLGVIEISRAMKLHREDNSFSDHQFDFVVRFKVELEVHLSNYFGTRVMLGIYGSTLNGFGTRSCDVDMSLSFPAGPPKGKVMMGGVLCPDLVMREVAKALVDYPNARDEQYICAKVPIVRFRGKDMDIEADISYRNDLALHNTQLLRQYCRWDEDRLPTLGIWVKTGVQNPSESQYVNGWNVDFWKFVDVGQSQRVGISTYELFVGFLDYFSNHFQYDTHVIQINTPGNVSKIGGRWHRSPMVIRDPFELDHNLAQGVDDDMFRYIRSCMRHSRSVFMDTNLRAEFLSSKGFRRGAFEKVRMTDDLLREYGVYLLHACVPVQQPPKRQFHGRDRTMSCSTNTSAS
ncbi:PAP-associated domain-containing protein [Trichostrongylus colubriformis]|uniref:PAP-associated domain-containing protein n=1 Tax=Trichostrongylus colubriformis TaxID=6319 RepID=A0AAN8FX40_TRICO